MDTHWFFSNSAPAEPPRAPSVEGWNASPAKLEELEAALSERIFLPPRLAQQILDLARNRAGLHALLDRIVITAYACLGPAAYDFLFAVEERTAVRWGLAPRNARVEIGDEASLSEARLVGSRLATRLGCGAVVATKVGTAISELVRNVRLYVGAGWVEFKIERRALVIEVGDRGPGIPDLDAIWAGTNVSRTGLGMGLRGVRAIADEFHIESGPTGTLVRLTFRPR